MTAISRLGYLGFEVSDVAAWERFAVDMLGLPVCERQSDGSIALRMDDQAQRIVIQPGASDDLAYAGFEVDDEATLRRLSERLSRAGFTPAELGDDVARARRVKRVVRVEDPNGVPIELFHGSERAAEPFRSSLVPSGFVTGNEGLGHVVFGTMDAQATERFYCELLGMKLSDRIDTELAPGFSLLITFLHANPRHHTVAFAAAPMPKHIHHFMLEVVAMDEVGQAYDRVLKAGVPIARTLGRHPNDHMFSFYAQTPSGFEVEFGWGGRKVDDTNWQVGHYDRMSIWGHHLPGSVAG